MSLTALLVAAALWQDPPSAPPPAEAGNTGDIAWVRRPMPEFPERAVRARVWTGEARLRCTLTAEGRFAECEVIGESVSGAGFGPAALSSMRRARFQFVAGGPQPGDAYEATLRFYLPPELRSL
ncbi:TonB family protein [Brevundimonas sp.]|uniref:TonB family protein n=1 Tax=Brevundimonas sp. TaxID=1871086 RepID=UPI003F712253